MSSRRVVAVVWMTAIVIMLAMPSGLVAQDQRDATDRESNKPAKHDPFLQGLLRLADTGGGAPSPEDEGPAGAKPITFTDQISPTYFTIPGGDECPADKLADGLPEEREDDVPDDDTIAFNDQVPPTHFEIPGGDKCPAGGVANGYSIFNSTTVTNASRNARVQTVIGELPAITVVPSNAGKIGWVPDATEMVPGGALAGHEMDPELRIYVTSLGNVGASAIEVSVVSSDPDPVAMIGGAVVLEPVTLSDQATERLAAERRELVRQGHEATTIADAYCLELLRELPTPGTVLRIASAELQQRYAPIRGVLDAARKVRDLGQLVPDSDPEEYFQSIRQWAIWSLEERLDEDGFAHAFLEQTRKNFDNVGRQWTADVEQLVQGLVPNRWRDIQKVLQAAQSASREPGQAPPVN